MPQRISNKGLEKRLVSHKYPDSVILIREHESYKGSLYSECGEPAVCVNEDRRTYYYFLKKGDRLLLPVFTDKNHRKTAFKSFVYSSNGRTLKLA